MTLRRRSSRASAVTRPASIAVSAARSSVTSSGRYWRHAPYSSSYSASGNSRRSRSRSPSGATAYSGFSRSSPDGVAAGGGSGCAVKTRGSRRGRSSGPPPPPSANRPPPPPGPPPGPGKPPRDPHFRKIQTGEPRRRARQIRERPRDVPGPAADVHGAPRRRGRRRRAGGAEDGRADGANHRLRDEVRRIGEAIQEVAALEVGAERFDRVSIRRPRG